MTNLLGHLIRQKREEKKLSREKLAAIAGYSPTTVRKAETGVSVDPQTLTDLAQAVGLEAVTGWKSAWLANITGPLFPWSRSGPFASKGLAVAYAKKRIDEETASAPEPTP